MLQHRHESHNNQETTFDFTEANYERVCQAVPMAIHWWFQYIMTAWERQGCSSAYHDCAQLWREPLLSVLPGRCRNILWWGGPECKIVMQYLHIAGRRGGVSVPQQLQAVGSHPAAGPCAAAERGLAQPGGHEQGSGGARLQLLQTQSKALLSQPSQHEHDFDPLHVIDTGVATGKTPLQSHSSIESLSDGRSMPHAR